MNNIPPPIIEEEDCLQVIGLTKKRGHKIITSSFSIAKGKAIALLGQSGCGKSTILYMLAGLIPPDSGQVLLNKIDITSVPAGKRNIGMVFQDYALFPHLTVQDNIGYGLISQGMSKRESRKAAKIWLKKFGLINMEKRHIEHLSGGEKQRVALARTLAVKPQVILFDEPLSALDTALRIRLQQELKKNRLEIGYTAVYVTHDEKEACFLADHIIRMPEATAQDYM